MKPADKDDNPPSSWATGLVCQPAHDAGV
jgi:hypothetical protein